MKKSAPQYHKYIVHFIYHFEKKSKVRQWYSKLILAVKANDDLAFKALHKNPPKELSEQEVEYFISFLLFDMGYHGALKIIKYCARLGIWYEDNQLLAADGIHFKTLGCALGGHHEAVVGYLCDLIEQKRYQLNVSDVLENIDKEWLCEPLVGTFKRLWHLIEQTKDWNNQPNLNLIRVIQPDDSEYLDYLLNVCNIPFTDVLTKIQTAIDYSAPDCLEVLLDHYHKHHRVPDFEELCHFRPRDLVPSLAIETQLEHRYCLGGLYKEAQWLNSPWPKRCLEALEAKDSEQKKKAYKQIMQYLQQILNLLTGPKKSELYEFFSLAHRYFKMQYQLEQLSAVSLSTGVEKKGEHL